MTTPNEKMAAYWNEEAGPRWVDLQEKLDASIHGIGLEAIEAAAPAAGESVLDVGCGCGATVLELARRVGPAGRVHGLDLSEPMLGRARERAQAEGHAHVSFERADAQVRAFDGGFDLAFSRFGVMFFDDPVAGFGNLRSAVRTGGRLAFVCWREREKNPWMWTAMAASAHLIELPPPPEDPHAPGPFGLHDAERLAGLLADAGWADAELRDLDVTMKVAGGGPLDRAVEHAMQMGPMPGALAGVDEDTRERVREAIREALKEHQQPEGVLMPAAARIVTARRPD
jgi:SAM-dependent methyltransferase